MTTYTRQQTWAVLSVQELVLQYGIDNASAFVAAHADDAAYLDATDYQLAVYLNTHHISLPQ